MTPTEQKSKLALTIYLPAALRREVEHEAADAGQTLSTYVERALVSYIKAKAAPSFGAATLGLSAPVRATGGTVRLVLR
jgi:hypothetical protein